MIVSKNPEPNSTRAGYGQALLQLGKNKKVVALSADLTKNIKNHLFAEKYPNRFFQCGVAEQNMVAMAAGLALEGFIPFASSFSVFVPMRCLDQIRISVCYNQANVKLVGSHCGLSNAKDGAAHQALEDVAALRSLPNLTIIEPCDYHQALKATLAAAKHQGPVYLRLHRHDIPLITNSWTKFKIGRAQILQKGQKLTIISAGQILSEVLAAVKMLNFKPEIINCHTIKPLDEKTILRSAKKTGKVLVVHEHQVYGGLGSAITELLAEKCPVPVKIMGVKDQFGVSGQVAELYQKYGLDAEHILREIHNL